MDKTTAFAVLQQMSDGFIAQIAHPEGGRVTRALLRNVDAEFVDELFVVFKNKDGKLLVLPFTAGLPSASAMKITPESGKKEFPSLREVRSEYMERILPFLIRKDASITDQDKLDLSDYVDEWCKISPFNPENIAKLNQYNLLKQELTEAGLI